MICPSHDKGRRAAVRALPICVAALMLTMPAANAADWPGDAPLRGTFDPPAPAGSGVRWDGVNFGATFGVSTMNTDFGNSTSQSVAYILRNSTLENEARPSSWTTLPNTISNGRQWGGFLGYSMQWDDVIVGVDVGYNRMSSGGESTASDSLSRTVSTSDNVQHDVTIAASARSKLVDYATLRARGGYAIGQFMPYGFIGGAVGRFNYASTATVTSVETPPAPAVPYTFGPRTQTTGKDNAIVGGFTAGLGIDVALLPNVFLRGEYEFVLFAPVNGIRNTLNTGRVGVAVRF